MKPVLLPLIPNAPMLSDAESVEGDFLLKTFGPFGFVQNVLFDEDLIKYDGSYQNEQGLSSRFQDHLAEIYDFIRSNFCENATLVEIGCGKGAFLEIVKHDSFFNYFGFDESYVGEDPRISARYVTKDDRLTADVVVLRHTLEHIKFPHRFLELLRDVFGDDCVVFIEVPQFEWIVKNRVLFDFTYEHVNYFTSAALASLFENTIAAANCFDHQYQYVLAKLGDLRTSLWTEFENPKNGLDFDFEVYVQAFRHSLDKINDFGRIWIWGGGTKGVMFTKFSRDYRMDLFKCILSVIDVNPAKQGLFAPSSGVQIQSPRFLFENCMDNDLVLVMNPSYLNEIKLEIKSNTDKSIRVIPFGL